MTIPIIQKVLNYQTILTSYIELFEALIQRKKVNQQLEKMEAGLNKAKHEVEKWKEENKIEMDLL
jgi:hypothetical protein